MTTKDIEKQYLYVLYTSLFVLSFLIALIVLTDVRLNILGESHGAHLKAISIAISRLTYGIQGLAGLEQVLSVLNEIPSISTLKLESLSDYKDFNVLINQKISEAINLGNINTNELHGYLNDQAYLYFVIFAFSLFGIKLKSLTCFWILIFFISISVYAFSYRKKTLNLLVLLILLVSIGLIIITNPGVGNQLISIYNYRFIPILGLIPLLYVVFSINEQNKSIYEWFFLAIQILILVYVMLIRGSAQWMIIALFLFSSCYLFCAKKTLIGNVDKNKSAIKNIFRVFSSLGFVLLFLLSISSINSKILHEEYAKDFWSTSHGMWHPLVIGMTVDPLLFNKYVCTDEPLKDSLKGFRPLVCEEENKRYTNPRLYYGIFAQPSDMDGFHAAVRYLREQGLYENIGSTMHAKNHFNLNWDKYDQVLKKVFFNMIFNDPVNSIYMYLITKPLKYMKEVFSYSKYFLKGFAKANSIYVLMFVAIIPFIYIYNLVAYKKYLIYKKETGIKENNLLYYCFLIAFISSLVPSIIFYSQSHTIADSVTVLLAFCLFVPILFLKSRANYKT